MIRKTLFSFDLTPRGLGGRGGGTKVLGFTSKEGVLEKYKMLKRQVLVNVFKNK